MQPEIDKGHILRLWDYRDLLLYRSKHAEASEKEMLLRHADKVDKNIQRYLSEKPKNVSELKKLFAKLH